MASTSSSKKACYDIFINHHGVDVKRTLASSICNTLHLMGVQAFLDLEELEVDDFFPDAIQEAIRTASIHIAIFSPRYAESPSCLEELLLMVQTNSTIIPLFYNVNPSDLGDVTKGIYADAFYRHRHKGRYDPEKIKEWEEALRRISYLTGFIVDADKCDEGKLVGEIVDAVFHKMTKVPFGTFSVGLDEAVKDFERKVGSPRSEDVYIVGIVGMGGSGKTTLAKELYNRKRSSISRSSFLPNVRDAASTNTLHKLQEKLLKDLSIQHPSFDNKEEGIGILARGLRFLTVLIVLDDVDHVDQIEALLPDPAMHNVGRGSFIIITTREEEVLKSCGISSIYDMKLLDPFNAKQLFCRHAFLQKYSKPELEHLSENSNKFQDLIERFVNACNGLPLSLKVLGAMVNGESEAFWEAQLLKLSRILPKEISNRLKLSYDALDEEVQQMFLDVACFFIGVMKSLVVAIWDGSRWSGEIGFETLVNKCLIGLDQYDRIEMHDHLRDLGRQIACDSQPSRIWKEEQISYQGGRTLTRGIQQGLNWRKFDLIGQQPLEHFMENIINRPSLPKLQLLAVKGNDFGERFAALSRDLVWLRWHDFNGTNLPSWLSFANLNVLELYDAQNLEELWQDNVQLPLQLRELIINGTTNPLFGGLPRSIGHLRRLKKIVLNGNDSGMRRLPEEFCDLQSLEFLELSNFPWLSSLPDDFGKLINLRILIFSGVQLITLPKSFKQLRILEILDISNSQSFFFTSEMLNVLEFMTKLQTLRISHCPQLVESPHLITQVSLRELVFRYTGLRELPNNISQLTKLETLEIASDNLRSLPESLRELSCLTSLAIYNCDLLQFLPEALRCLSNLQVLNIHTTPVVELGLGMGGGPPSGCNLQSLKCLSLFNTKVSTISISDYCCPTLETIWLSCNNELTSISGLPKNVREIIAHDCKKLSNIIGISYLLNLKNLVITDCPKLELLQIPANMFSVRGTIRITACPKDDVISIVDDDGVIETAKEGKVSREIEDAALHKITNVPHDLEVNYDALDPQVQQMFLDVACFFIGEKKSLVVAIWDGSGWSGEVGWETLVYKCLVGLDKQGNIEMHEYHRDRGREIARDDSSSRIWNEEEICIQGRITQIRGITVRSCREGLNAFYPRPLGHFMEKMRLSLPELKLLAVRGDDFKEEFVASSRDLVWLRLWDFDGANLPSWLSLANLRVLELYNAKNLQVVWQDNVQPPKQLRELIIHVSGRTCFQALPRSIGHLKCLKKMVLNGCDSGMRSLPEDFCHLESLEYLELSGFPELSSLPHDFSKLIKLRTLELRSVQLTAFPDSFKQLMALQSLSLLGSKSFMFTSEMLDVLKFMKDLQVLRIVDCPEVKKLPHLTTEVSLRHLELTNTGLSELPNNMGQLTQLEILVIESRNMKNLPGSLGALFCLTSLQISCEKLKSLPEALWRLSNLQSLAIYRTPVIEIGLGISGCNLNSLKSLSLWWTRVCRISISDECCPSLETLSLVDNDYLTEIDTLPGNVREIYVEDCQRMKNMIGIGGLLNLERLVVINCPDLEVMPCPSYMHSVGHTISITGCPKARI